MKYLEKEDWDKPLSVAVFGPPGSGKSFTVEQILSTVDKKAAEKRLDFNVAQFKSLRDLEVAFHRVQDRALEGEPPLVIFDEFDTTFGRQPLGWLQYFLHPMQDGKFMSGEMTYKLGRAIFVFAGGTSHSFDAFYEKRKLTPDFQTAKGPDFVSRLQGYLDIKGIDVEDHLDMDLLMFRRAIILRYLLQKNLKIIIDNDTKVARIDDGVIRAFLRIPRFEHGLRSMEAILQMSAISQARRRFHVASLPPKDQLDMHVVDADKFLHYLNSDTTPPERKPPSSALSSWTVVPLPFPQTGLVWLPFFRLPF